MYRNLPYIIISVILLIAAQAAFLPIVFFWISIVFLYKFQSSWILIFATSFFLDVCLMQVPGLTFLFIAIGMICLSFLSPTKTGRYIGWGLLTVVISLLSVVWYHHIPLGVTDIVIGALSLLFFVHFPQSEEPYYP